MKPTEQKSINVVEHEKIYLCPALPKTCCDWEGAACEIVHHFEEEHDALLIATNTFIVDVNKSEELNNLMSLENQIYLIQTKFDFKLNKLWLRLRYLGTPEEASKLRYNIEIIIDDCCFSNKYVVEGFNPVYNIEGGAIEVDVQGAMLLSCADEIKQLLCQINFEQPLTPSSEDDGYNDLLTQLGKIDITNNERDSSIVEAIGPMNEKDFSVSIRGEREDNSFDCDEKEYGSLNRTISIRNSDSFFYVDYLNAEYAKFEAIRCTNCRHLMVPPIFVCPDGHSICLDCREVFCVICEKYATEFRNDQLEEVSKTLQHFCKFSSYGCNKKFPYSEIRTHEIFCEFYIYKCELCIYQGKSYDMKNHFRIVHPSVKIYEMLQGIPFPKDSTLAIINAYNVFYCVSDFDEGNVVWKVLFCGPRERNFSCEVKIKGRRYSTGKRYVLKRNENVFILSVPLEQLKVANVKQKNAMLHIFTY